MGNPDWLLRFREGLDSLASESIRREVLSGSEGVADLNDGGKAHWVSGAMERLDQVIPDESTRYQIMAHCSCQCADEFTTKFRDEYRQHGDIDRLLESMFGVVFLVRPRRVGDVIYQQKVACHAEEYSKATTLQEKRYHYCHCDWIRAIDGAISPTHCFCSAGWYQRIWERILEKPVTVRLVKSIMQGDDCCEFAVHL